MTPITTPAIPARMSVDALKRLAAEHHLELLLNWRWVGRERHGVLTVSKDGEVLFSESFVRRTQVWGPGDERFDLVRTGSPKHMVVKRALASLRGILATTERAAASEPL
jgi:hypothetical protein